MNIYSKKIWSGYFLKRFLNEWWWWWDFLFTELSEIENEFKLFVSIVSLLLSPSFVDFVLNNLEYKDLFLTVVDNSWSSMLKHSFKTSFEVRFGDSFKGNWGIFFLFLLWKIPNLNFLLLVLVDSIGDIESVKYRLL